MHDNELTPVRKLAKIDAMLGNFAATLLNVAAGQGRRTDTRFQSVPPKHLQDGGRRSVRAPEQREKDMGRMEEQSKS